MGKIHSLGTELLFSFSISLLGLFLLMINAFKYFFSKNGKERAYQIFSWYLVFTALTETACNIMGFLQPNSNLFLSHISLFISFSFLNYFFWLVLENKFFRKFIPIYFVLVTAIVLYQYFREPEKIWVFNLFEILSISVSLIVYALVYIYENLDKEMRYFHFAVGLIVYFLCSSAIFLSGNLDLVFYTKPVYLDVWIFNSVAFLAFQYFIYKNFKILNDVQRA